MKMESGSGFSVLYHGRGRVGADYRSEPDWRWAVRNLYVHHGAWEMVLIMHVMVCRDGPTN
jgi:hypothetical protein